MIYKKYNDEKNTKIRDLKKHLKNIKNRNSKIANKIQALIDYYSGMKNSDNSNKNNISSRTIQRLLEQYENGNFFYHKSNNDGVVKLSEYEEEIVLQNIQINPLRLGVNSSIWNEELLKYYIKHKFKVDVDENTCRKILHKSNTKYKAKNYNIYEHRELENEINYIIKSYKNKERCKVWYFDICYLGKIKETLGTKKYYGYIFFSHNNVEEEYMFDVGYRRKINDEINENILKEIEEKYIKTENEYKKNGSYTYVIVLNSDNNFKAVLKEINNYDIKLIFLPKGLSGHNETKEICTKIKKNKLYSKIAKAYKLEKVEDKLEEVLKKI